MPKSTPSNDDLIAYAADDLPAARAAEVEAHLAEHPQDAATVATYRSVASALARDDSQAPPEETVARAKALFSRAAGTPAPSWLDLVDAFIARIVFDSRVQPAAVRSTAMRDRVQLGFESEEVEVDLRAERVAPARDGASTGWRIVGQIIGEEGLEPLTVAAVSVETSAQVAETVTDARLAFDMTVPRGRYDLCIAHPKGTVVLPGIELE